MGLTDEELQALRTRLLPGGVGAVDAVADTVGDGEELRELLVDVHGDVVAFTDQRALFVAHDDTAVVAVDYSEIDVRRRPSGLGIDALLEGGRLVLDVAKGTFIRLAVVASGAPPGRASWLPERPPAPAPAPPPFPEPAVPFSTPAQVDVTAPPRPPVSSMPPVSTFPPVPPLTPDPSPKGPPASPTASPAPSSAAPSAGPAASASSAAEAPVAAEPGWTVPSMPPPGLPPAGWNPDPSGRHWWRWWDGMSWTDHVADGGPSFVDPLPPR